MPEKHQLKKKQALDISSVVEYTPFKGKNDERKQDV